MFLWKLVSLGRGNQSLNYNKIVLRPNETHQTCTKLGLSEHLSFSRSMWINESGNYKNMLQLQLEGQDLIRGLDDDYFLSYSLLVNNKFLSIKLSGVFFWLDLLSWVNCQKQLFYFTLNDEILFNFNSFYCNKVFY